MRKVQRSPREATPEELYEAVLNLKMVVVGDSGVGKTALVKRYITGIYTEGPCTVGVELSVMDITVDGKPVRVGIYDTAGQERFAEVTQNFYSRSHCALVVFDISAEGSFFKVPGYIRAIQQRNANCYIMIVGNKADKAAQRRVQRDQIDFFVAKLNLVYHEVSALKNDENTVITALDWFVTNAARDKIKEMEAAPADGIIKLGVTPPPSARKQGETGCRFCS
jgi:Ras-related protein Rab-2A